MTEFSSRCRWLAIVSTLRKVGAFSGVFLFLLVCFCGLGPIRAQVLLGLRVLSLRLGGVGLRP